MASLDQIDRVVLLTGATSGVGRVAAQQFATDGWTVIAVGRDAQAGSTLEREAEDFPGSIRFLRTDLSQSSSVRRLADQVRAEYDRLDVLANNAGLSTGDWKKTPSGVELTMSVNHLAPFLLTYELIDLLIDADGRIITTASEFHRRGSLDVADLWFEESFDSLDAYARSKLANIVFTFELAQRLPDGTVAHCFHPGFVPTTGLFRDAQLHVRMAIQLAAKVPGIGTSEEAGASRLLELATHREYGRQNGVYLGGDGPMTPDQQASDPDIRSRLWEESAAVLGIDPNWP